MVELLFAAGEFLFGAGEVGAGIGAAELGAGAAEAGFAGLGAEAGIDAATAATLGEEGFDFAALGGGLGEGAEAFGLFGPEAAGDLFNDVFASLTADGWSAQDAASLANQVTQSVESGSLSLSDVQQAFNSTAYRDPFATGAEITQNIEGFGTGGESAGESAAAAAGAADSAEGTAAVGGEGPGAGQGGAAEAGIGSDAQTSVEGIGNVGNEAQSEAEAAADAAQANANPTGNSIGSIAGGNVGANVASVGVADSAAAAASGVAQGLGAPEAFGPDVLGLENLDPAIQNVVANEPAPVTPGGFSSTAGPASTAGNTVGGSFGVSPSEAIAPGTGSPTPGAVSAADTGETLGSVAADEEAFADDATGVTGASKGSATTGSITGSQSTAGLLGNTTTDVLESTPFNTDITETPDPGNAPTGLSGFSHTQAAQGVSPFGIGTDITETPDPGQTFGVTSGNMAQPGTFSETIQGSISPPGTSSFDEEGFVQAAHDQPGLMDTAEQIAAEPTTIEAQAPTQSIQFGPTQDELAFFTAPQEPGLTDPITSFAPEQDPAFTTAGGPQATETEVFGSAADARSIEAPTTFAENAVSPQVGPSVEEDLANESLLGQGEPGLDEDAAQQAADAAARGINTTNVTASVDDNQSFTYGTGKDTPGTGSYATGADAAGAGGGLTLSQAALAGGLGLSALTAALQAGKGSGGATALPPQGNAAASNAATQQAAGTSELNRAINLDLTPAEQALLEQQARDRENRIRQLQFSAGIDPNQSTMAAQQTALSQEQTLRDTQGFIQNHFQQGIALLGGAASTQVALSQQQIALQTQFNQLLAQTTSNFAATLVKVGAVASGAKTAVAI